MVRTQIQLTEDQARALRELAIVQQCSMAELIRRSVDTLLQEQRTTERRLELKQRALAAVGRFRSGVEDLSSEHDQYLQEAFDG